MAAGLTRTQFSEQSEEATRLSERLLFLRSAFDGSGGFASLPPSQTISPNGAVADIPTWATTSYLLKHEGENWAAYEARRLVARYLNQTRRAIQHWVSLLVRQAPTRGKMTHPALVQFHKDCDGAGTPWDTMREAAITEAVLYPGIPWTVDRPRDSEARNAAENLGGPRFALRLPDTLYDWKLDSTRRFKWLKFVEEIEDKEGPTDAGRSYLRATVWHRNVFEVWEMTSGESRPPTLRSREPNKLGIVPAGVLTFADAIDRTALFGWSPGGELADLACQDYNDLSRLTDFLARGTFPMFLVPVEEGDEEEVQALEVGTMTAYGYPKDAAKAPGWASQDPHPIDSHNKRREINEAEALKAMGLESLLRTSNVPTSALAKKYENEHLDASLRRVGQRTDRWEREVVRAWLLWWGETQERADKILAEYKNESPESYNIEDVDSLIAQVEKVVAIPGVDPYTLKAALSRLSDAMVKLSPEEQEKREEFLAAQLKAQLLGESEDDNDAAGPEADGAEASPEGTEEPGEPEAEAGAEDEAAGEGEQPAQR